ncbi:aminodeoxychorismate lyase [Alteromonas sp. BMJM2]|uniref:aminodeoxychorismate lyase n=1 Tax=Alteromonas sp. BMJM2 TaxID=2954241 RepID=UPI0022B321CD|nr:aminodeoxychorismate lyase [Alteromonas sp. BMJM2]
MKIISSDMPIASSDRAFNYGDGVFTTLCVVNDHPELLSLHLSRLSHDSAAIGLSIDIRTLESAIWSTIRTLHTSVGLSNKEPSQISDEKNAVSERASSSSQHEKSEIKYVLKVHVSGGEAGRGYSRDEANPPLVRFSQHPYPNHYDSLLGRGVTLMCAQTALAIQPALAGIKHMNRLEQVLIKREINQADADDALVCDTQGNVIECSAGNIFFFTDNTWCTPSLTGSGVNGVVRQCLLNALGDENVPYMVGEFTLSDVKRAKYVVITNALMKVLPVKSISFTDGGTSIYSVNDNNIHALQSLLLKCIEEQRSCESRTLEQRGAEALSYQSKRQES